jgi:prepilin-type N-terminal cleavage/methylation domain-containing protein
LKPANCGFTLLEIVLTVAIIATVLVFAFPKFSGGQTELRAAVRRIGVVSREAKRMSKLYNSTYRLVLDVAPSEGEKTEDFQSQFWVEKAPGSILTREEKDQKENDEDDPGKEPLFSLDKRIMKKPEVLPSGLEFKKVEFANQKDPVIKGKAYVYYLPEGLVTEAAIHLHFGDLLKWTLAIHPLTGRVDIFDKEISLEDLRRQ